MTGKHSSKTEEPVIPAWPGAELWKIERIKPHPDNPRTHPPAQLALLASLFKRWGPDQPIVVDQGGVILKGHGRLQAAFIAGMKDFPVTQHKNLPESEKVAMRIADNQVGLLSGWDQERIRAQLTALRLAGYPTALLGFGDKQLVQFETVPGPPGTFPQFGADIAVEHECPSCGYRWSGQSAPRASAPEEKPKTRKKKKKK